MRKGILKKLTSIVLTLALLFSMSSLNFAEDAGGTTTDALIFMTEEIAIDMAHDFAATI